MKILYVTTISNTVNAFLIPHIEMLIKEGHQVDVAFNIVQDVDARLINLRCEVHNLEFQRSPFKKDNIIAYKKLKNLIVKKNYDVVHTHTPVASACVRLACRNLNEVKVIYTAHGFHFYKGAPLINWIAYYPIEKFLSRYTDTLITINQEDYNRAKQNFKAKNIEYIPGVGIDIERYKKINIDVNFKKQELDIPEDAIILLSVGELNNNKNHEVIIKALSKINNPNVYYLICGQGELKGPLLELANSLHLKKQVKLLGYRKDIDKICAVSDIFVFPSFREGLSVSVMEAMATGLSVVCSDIRGNCDLIEPSLGGYLVSPKEIEGFRVALNELIEDEKLRTRMATYNTNKIQQFGIKSVMPKIKEIYKN